MKNTKTVEAVYIYIYIERFNKIRLERHRNSRETMYFRRI